MKKYFCIVWLILAIVSFKPVELCFAQEASANSQMSNSAESDPISQLQRNPSDPAPTGLYRKDEEINFNVLDKVTFNPKTGGIKLIGHHDEAYGDRKIPYLQHLATLLEYPQPEFSLHWTSESSERVDAFLNRQLSNEELTRAVDMWGTMFDQTDRNYPGDRRLTEAGRALLPILGVHPTDNGKEPGYLGIQVKLNNDNHFEVTSVDPGSPAERAGLVVGDTFFMPDLSQAIRYPLELYRRIKFAGAGAAFEMQVWRSQWTPMTITLGSSQENPWDNLDRSDVMERLLRVSGNEEGARVTRLLGIAVRAAADDSLPKDIREMSYLDFMLNVVPDVQAYNALSEKSRNHEISPEEFDVTVKRWRCQGFEKEYRLPEGRAAEIFDEALRQGKTPRQAALECGDAVDNQLKESLGAWWDEQYKRPEGIQIAPELVEKALGIHPEMEPEYINVDSHSQLARLLYESDYLGKRLINTPGLRDKIPGYMSEFAFYRVHPDKQNPAQTTTSYHMWISLVGVDLARSKDGRTLKTGNVRMRFNIRQFGPGRQDLPPVSGGYEELLTSQYDEFAKVYPAFHELRETAKLAAVTHWLKSFNGDFKLPDEGRSKWDGPARLPGLVYRYYHPDKNDSPHITTIAAGGISLVPLEAFPEGNAGIRLADSEELQASNPEAEQTVEISAVEGVPIAESSIETRRSRSAAQSLEKIEDAVAGDDSQTLSSSSPAPAQNPRTRIKEVITSPSSGEPVRIYGNTPRLLREPEPLSASRLAQNSPQEKRVACSQILDALHKEVTVIQEAIEGLNKSMESNNEVRKESEETIDKAVEEAKEKLPDSLLGGFMTFTGNVLDGRLKEASEETQRAVLKRMQGNITVSQRKQYDAAFKILSSQNRDIKRVLDQFHDLETTHSIQEIDEALSKHDVTPMERFYDAGTKFIGDPMVQKVIRFSENATHAFKFIDALKGDLDVGYLLAQEYLSWQNIKQVDKNAIQYLRAVNDFRSRLQTTMKRIKAVEDEMKGNKIFGCT